MGTVLGSRDIKAVKQQEQSQQNSGKGKQ